MYSQRVSIGGDEWIGTGVHDSEGVAPFSLLGLSWSATTLLFYTLALVNLLVLLKTLGTIKLYHVQYERQSSHNGSIYICVKLSSPVLLEVCSIYRIAIPIEIGSHNSRPGEVSFYWFHNKIKTTGS